MDLAQAKMILETAFICSQKPMTIADIQMLFADAIAPDTIKVLLDELKNDWVNKGVELACVETGWRLQSRPEMRQYLDLLEPERTPKYTRASLETLAIIAYRQPVTRGDLEDIRGVSINANILKQFEDRGWVEVVGHREAPGRPALYATTAQFLSDMGVKSLDELPMLDMAPSVPDPVPSSEETHPQVSLELQETESFDITFPS